jgi:hypothetical protein
MDGRRANGLVCALALSFLGMTGCSDLTPPRTGETSNFGVCSCFDAANTGTIQGQVIWTGEPPSADAFTYRISLSTGDRDLKTKLRQNVFAPAVDRSTQGVENAVVFLRCTEPMQVRPWHHPPVVVEQRDLELQILQGATATRVGFVRRGDSIEIVSRDRHFHSLRASGAANFTLAFPDREQSLCRSLNRNGIVKLTSGAGYYWMRAYLLVDDHPYYTRTDAWGRFTLELVPPGRYEVVCWLPDWRELTHDRDPESGAVCRLHFGEPKHNSQTVNLAANETKQLHFELAAEPLPSACCR